MLFYQINLEINSSIIDEFLTWLTPHIQEVLTFKGFIKAEVLFDLEEDKSERKKISVHYYIDSYEHYQDYITHHAPKMREIALKKFADNLSAHRRILEIKSTINSINK